MNSILAAFAFRISFLSGNDGAMHMVQGIKKQLYIRIYISLNRILSVAKSHMSKRFFLALINDQNIILLYILEQNKEARNAAYQMKNSTSRKLTGKWRHENSSKGNNI